MTDQRAREIANRVAFITQALLPLLDELEETTTPKREFKYHLKRAIAEAEKVVAQHFKAYNEFGKITQPDGMDIDAKDVYYITARAYDFLLHRPPNEVGSIAELVKGYEAGGVDWKDFEIEAKQIV